VFEIGASLRQTREQQGLTLAEIEHGTRIRERYLAALENEQFDALPGEAYAKGFLRQYAEALGLDGNVYVRELTERLEEQEAPPPPPEPRRRDALRQIPVVSVFAVVALAIAVVGGIAAWKLSDSETTPPVKLPSPAPQPAAVKRPAHARHHAVQAHKRAKRQTPRRLVLTATRGDCWLLVRARSAEGAILYEGTLHPGATLRFRTAPLWIRAGAPWNLSARLGPKLLHGLPPQTGNFVVTRRGLALA
jgi:transcriptional regulator with XRE-family HTH domain